MRNVHIGKLEWPRVSGLIEVQVFMIFSLTEAREVSSRRPIAEAAAAHRDGSAAEGPN
jgi:hypothetical protein